MNTCTHSDMQAEQSDGEYVDPHKPSKNANASLAKVIDKPINCWVTWWYSAGWQKWSHRGGSQSSWSCQDNWQLYSKGKMKIN